MMTFFLPERTSGHTGVSCPISAQRLVQKMEAVCRSDGVGLESPVHPPDHQTRPRVYQLQGIKPGTVRHAFLALADEGLVHIRHGRTTTIAGEPA
jgi:hypothetical protein